MKKGTVYTLMVFALGLLVLLAVLLFAAPTLVSLYTRWRAASDAVYNAILTAFYCSALPAGTALGCLILLLRNLLSEQPFLQRNARLIGLVSWCCVVVAAASAVTGFWYAPLFLLAAAMLFFFLVLRVICSCFRAAIALKEENSLTI